LTREAFDGLLARLSPDRETAGVMFEALRHKLLQYFSYEACAFPDRWADETLDRVAKRLADGSSIEEINAFTRGVARMVLREARLAEIREQRVREFPDAGSIKQIDAETDAVCLDQCIRALPPQARELVEQYYLGTSQSKVRARTELAARMGINMEALRNRALRVRRRLEICLEECREKPEGRDIIDRFSSDKNRR
jgi:DNA-directed RNA polymerase specialized sigma24 family protein